MIVLRPGARWTEVAESNVMKETTTRTVFFPVAFIVTVNVSKQMEHVKTNVNVVIMEINVIRFVVNIV